MLRLALVLDGWPLGRFCRDPASILEMAVTPMSSIIANVEHHRQWEVMYDCSESFFTVMRHCRLRTEVPPAAEGLARLSAGSAAYRQIVSLAEGWRLRLQLRAPFRS